METLKERLEEQKKRHEGGSKMIGSGGTSPFGNSGYNPEGVRIGQDGRHGKAVKVWDKREYKNPDDWLSLVRATSRWLRRLRKWARQGAETELDLPDRSKARPTRAILIWKLVAERHNTVKVLIFFDIGGSMDSYIKPCECSSVAKPNSSTWNFSTSITASMNRVKDNRRRA